MFETQRAISHHRRPRIPVAAKLQTLRVAVMYRLDFTRRPIALPQTPCSGTAGKRPERPIRGQERLE